ncbi:nitric oxide reductase F protein [Roseovarius spongiae]|uniref:Nitric oxide reductase F protein n=1 Tax=Roseovarius spongiae TaxID=2320272 RepID=A0A3A8B4M8_9RHOB|nr:cytochrome C oxidase subunit IV family protein [Roseovarius spongiae]RKF13507.1 nitric oxide reductase F protein [Roseovarius spongiae]
MTRPDKLTFAWISLLVLSGATTIVAELVNLGFDPRVTGTLVLFLALMKARIILARYLGLAEAPSWRRGFNLALSLFCLLLLGLYLGPLL